MLALYTVGSGVGVGFGLTALAAAILLLYYSGRGHNLELFLLVCLVGSSAALGPFVGGWIRDRLGGFAPTFELTPR